MPRGRLLVAVTHSNQRLLARGGETGGGTGGRNGPGAVTPGGDETVDGLDQKIRVPAVQRSERHVVPCAWVENDGEVVQEPLGPLNSNLNSNGGANEKRTRRLPLKGGRLAE
ncbi:hypothetical protein Naga_101679g1 [Nannochloropsis gaditana]|uniref:Uncharacterized protein n=1 Tax=Nannochloropsis gaditana TaxID=72520 RepID=W7THA0_9STRA|nr:hypothetical protein Naga_101679g1 [Nannochloropsis gaditana]